MLVAIPTILASTYYGLIASDRYVSHVQYLVRGVNTRQAGGLGALLTTIGISRTADDTSAVQAFIQSRAAIEKLNEMMNLREIYGSPGADFLARYPRPWETDNFERLYWRTQSYISVLQDQATGITSLDVQAFRPEDARRVAAALLKLAEDMVNKMNERAEADAVTTAERELERARDAVVAAQTDLTNFRNQELLVDPSNFARVLLEGIGELSLERAQTQAEIDEKASLSPNSPALPPLQAKVDALTQKIFDERKKLAGDDAALADKVSSYERLTLLRDLADKRYGNALAALRSAQLDAQRQNVYIEEMVPPNLPDESTEPQRLRMIATVFVLSFAVFAVFWIITVGSKDHAQ